MEKRGLDQRPGEKRQMAAADGPRRGEAAGAGRAGGNVARWANGRCYVFLLALLLFAPPLLAVCPTAERTAHIPAVVNDQEGGLLRLFVRVEPGNGTVYTAVDPTVGISTQLSEQRAAAEAFANLSIRREECDVHFSFESLGDSSRSVDGPSAGLAMATALRAALTGRTIREDVTATGAILAGGGAGEVGGLIDKAQAASRMGQRILITPKQQLYENIMLRALSGRYNFSAVEVQTMEQAFEIATSPPGTPYKTTYKLENRRIPKGLAEHSMSDEEQRFSDVAKGINDELETQVNAGATGALAPYRDYFKNEIGQNRRLIGMGYAYTAANNAFLSQVDAAFLTTPPSRLDVEGEIGNVLDCVDRAPPVKLTDRNLEMVAGAGARISWAVKKVAEVRERLPQYHSSEEKYMAVRELYFARSWCEAATRLMRQAGQMGGEELDADGLQALARDTVEALGRRVRGSLVDDDTRWHYKTANQSLTQGDYLAALYDGAYANGMQQAFLTEINATQGEIEARTDALANRRYSRMWARIYQSQGLFTRADSQEQRRTGTEAHRVLELAESMEEGMNAARGALLQPPLQVKISPNGGMEKGERSRLPNLAAGMLAAAVLLALVMRIGKQLKRRQERG